MMRFTGVVEAGYKHSSPEHSNLLSRKSYV